MNRAAQQFWATHNYGAVYSEIFGQEFGYLPKSEQELITESPEGLESARLAMKVGRECDRCASGLRSVN